MRSYVVLIAALLLCPFVARCADLDTIEAEVTSKWDKIDSMTYDMVTSMNQAGQGYSIKMDSTGNAEMKHKDAKTWLMKMDSKTDMIQSMAGKDNKMASTTLMVVDGEYSYTVSDTNGVKSGTKMKAAQWTEHAGGKGFFKWLREENDCKVLPDESVDGVSCYVVEATSKKGGPQAMAMKYCFSKDHGMAIGIDTKGPDGKVISTTKLTNIKMNPSIPDDHFVFKAPAGVVMQDMDALKNQAAAAQQANSNPPPAKEEPAKETAAKKDEPAKADEPAKKDDPAPAKKDEPAKKDDDKPKKKKSKVPGF